MDATIARIINDFDLDAYRPIVSRELDLGAPLTPRAGNLATVLMGMRRCGKTYRLFQEMDSLLASGVACNRMLYFNFEDDRLLPVTSQTGDAVLETYFGMNPDAYDEGVYLFFDEIQEMQGWDVWLRRVIDTTKATVYVTGSSSKLLSEDIATAFRGRSVAYELSPYSFREFVRVHCPELARSTLSFSSRDRAKALQSLEEFLQRGGFPAVQGESTQRLALVLQGYAQRTVAKDVLERHNLGNPQAVSLFAQRLLSMSGREVSLRKMENSLKSSGVPVGRNTLAQVLDYFEDAFLVGVVREFSRSIAQSASAMPKVYAADPGLAFANSLATTQDRGQRVETAVYNELRRRNNSSRRGSIASLKTREGGFEIDFVVGDALDARGWELYQVCEHVDDAATRTRELRALDQAMREQGLSEGFLLVCEGDERDIAVSSGTVHQLPLWRWLLG